MEFETSPTLEELANGQNGADKDAVDGATMPSPAVLAANEDHRIKRKARRLIRTGSREGHPNMVIPGQASSAFVAPQRRYLLNCCLKYLFYWMVKTLLLVAANGLLLFYDKVACLPFAIITFLFFASMFCRSVTDCCDRFDNNTFHFFVFIFLDITTQILIISMAKASSRRPLHSYALGPDGKGANWTGVSEINLTVRRRRLYRRATINSRTLWNFPMPGAVVNNNKRRNGPSHCPPYIIAEFVWLVGSESRRPFFLHIVNACLVNTSCIKFVA